MMTIKNNVNCFDLWLFDARMQSTETFCIFDDNKSATVGKIQKNRHYSLPASIY